MICQFSEVGGPRTRQRLLPHWSKEVSDLFLIAKKLLRGAPRDLREAFLRRGGACQILVNMPFWVRPCTLHVWANPSRVQECVAAACRLHGCVPTSLGLPWWAGMLLAAAVTALGLRLMGEPVEDYRPQ